MQWLKRGIFLVFALWIAVTLTALAAMYHLWWTRERTQYVGKSPEQQRELVFRTAGIPVGLLQGVRDVWLRWPLEARYRAEGNFNQLSYVKYLLIPRMPDGTGEYLLRTEGERIVLHPAVEGNTADNRAQKEYPPSIRGFLLSMLLLTGMAALLRRLPWSIPWTLPEGYGAAAFCLMVVTVLSRGLSGSAWYGFAMAAVVGVGGLVLSLAGMWRKGIHWPNRPIFNKRSWLFHLPFALLLAGVVVWSALMAVVVVPDDWDAWAMWGAKAKTLALGSGPLRDVTLFGHADYPLLWSSVWAFSGWLTGGWEEHWSRGWGAVFLLLAVWEMGLVVRHLTGGTRMGLLAAALFLSMPKVPLLASWSYAEAPFWLMLACGCGNLLLWCREQLRGYLVKGAFFCAVAAYTKNEGLLFSLFCLAWIIIERPRQWAGIMRCFLAPLLVLLLPWNIWIRAILHLDSRHFDGFGAGFSLITSAMAKLPDTLEAISRLWCDVRQWNIVLIGLVLASFWLFVRSRELRRSLFLPWGMLAAYLGITLSYVDYLWLVGTAWDRLTAQVLVVLIIVVAGGTTGENQPILHKQIN